MKQYNIRHNVGNAKYVVNYHDGVKKHKDGSDFFDMMILSNKRKLDVFIQSLQFAGFIEK